MAESADSALVWENLLQVRGPLRFTGCCCRAQREDSRKSWEMVRWGWEEKSSEARLLAFYQRLNVLPLGILEFLCILRSLLSVIKRLNIVHQLPRQLLVDLLLEEVTLYYLLPGRTHTLRHSSGISLASDELCGECSEHSCAGHIRLLPKSVRFLKDVFPHSWSWSVSEGNGKTLTLGVMGRRYTNSINGSPKAKSLLDLSSF